MGRQMSQLKKDTLGSRGRKPSPLRRRGHWSDAVWAEAVSASAGVRLLFCLLSYSSVQYEVSLFFVFKKNPNNIRATCHPDLPLTATVDLF